MAKYEFKVGDRVQFKSWKEMEKEFGVDCDGNIDKIGFVKSMKYLCGTLATIDYIYDSMNIIKLKDFTSEGRNWSYSTDMIKPYKPNQNKKEPKINKAIIPLQKDDQDDQLDAFVYAMQGLNIDKSILPQQETVNHPSHYNKGKIEVIDYIEDKGFNFNLGNAVKYISRCEHKGKKVEDLNKAIWYLQREIERGNKNDR